MESRFGDSAYAYAQSWTANSKPAPVISSIHLRPFRESDLPAIRSLFDVSFPISYNDDFFECVRVQFFRGNKLVTYIAELLEEVAHSSLRLLYRMLLSSLASLYGRNVQQTGAMQTGPSLGSILCIRMCSTF